MSAGPTPHSRGNKAAIAAQTAAAYELRLTGLSIRDIAGRLGIPASTVHVRITTALRERVDPLVELYRAVELDRLDQLAVKAWEVLNADHVVVSNGRVVLDPGTGQPMKDDAPVLQAIDRLIRITESRRKLLGLDAPLRADLTVTPVDPTDIELARMIEEARARSAAEEAQLRGQHPTGEAAS